MAGVIILLMSCSAGKVQSQPAYDRYDDGYNNRQERGFDYYPNANVYFDISFNRYWYNRGNSWFASAFLPPGLMLGKEACHRVYYRGPEIWRDNHRHRKQWCQPERRYGYNNRRNNDWDDDRRYNRGYDRRDQRWGRGRSRNW